ncbi:hypothetical protein L249_4411 [Ophiocordyceps polyrhachis-furcata BCC 54312]|uniref:Enoyl reductase (ER) domain-containing protein n=1 Tax=Ophiocordyceps polyrhachis-furcata BCC 54312 TaxID=1330021 RepID=A0A367L7M3_9HYPO|nr:hypothetical protein L249_4411 [Ophiocordyceps polyrhachis-furcata BCC 54312]
MPRVLTLSKIEGGKPGKVYYPLQLQNVGPPPEPGPDEVLVRVQAAALNHRDLFQRRHLYPSISFDRALLSDGSAVVLSTGSNVSPGLKGKPVVLAPMRGWASDPLGPEPGSRVEVAGGSLGCDSGTAREYMVLPACEVEVAPGHLSAVEAAALPLAGLTAWRAVVSKARVKRGQNVLVTGVGGGVALQALQFVVAFGARAFVTSGEDVKISRAVTTHGATAGVSYRLPDWDGRLRSLLPKERPYLDAVIDGAGGDVIGRSLTLLRSGGVVVQYGMTLAPTMDWTMRAVLANVELKGSTGGSRREFADMVAFVAEKRIRPVVWRSVRGLGRLEAIDGLFEDMDAGRQFGKLVIEIGVDDEAEEEEEEEEEVVLGPSL